MDSADFSEFRARPKRPRVFGGHAVRWKYGMHAEQPGQLVRMDHMSVSFRGAVEQACQARGIAPYVLPPQNPQYNAGVERAHRSLRQKFYRHDCNLLSLNPALHAFQHHYRHYRPHTGKRQNMLTPMAYYQSLKEAA